MVALAVAVHQVELVALAFLAKVIAVEMVRALLLAVEVAVAVQLLDLAQRQQERMGQQEAQRHQTRTQAQRFLMAVVVAVAHLELVERLARMLETGDRRVAQALLEQRIAAVVAVVDSTQAHRAVMAVQVMSLCDGLLQQQAE